MRHVLGPGLVAALLVAAPGCGKKPGPPPEVAAPAGIEGNWTLVALEYAGDKDEKASKGAENKIRATAGQLIATKGGKADPLDYTLDPSKEPPAIDLKAPGGKGETMYGIYKLDGDTLTICAVGSSRPADRPTEFKTTPANGAMMMTLKRDG